MRAEEIQGLMEAYSQVYSPQVISEESIQQVADMWVDACMEIGVDFSDYTLDELTEAFIADMSSGEISESVLNEYLGMDSAQNAGAGLRQAFGQARRAVGSAVGKVAGGVKDVMGAGYQGYAGQKTTSSNPLAKLANASTRFQSAPIRAAASFAGGLLTGKNTSSDAKAKPTFQNSGGFGRYGAPGSQVKTPTPKPSAGPGGAPIRPVPGNERATAPTAGQKPSAPTPAAKPSTPAAKPSTPAAKPSTPAAKPAGSAMDQWRAANPKLAAASDEKARIRGTQQTDNPLMKDMKSNLPMKSPSVQAPEVSKLGAGNQSLTQNSNALKAATPKPVTPSAAVSAAPKASVPASAGNAISATAANAAASKPITPNPSAGFNLAKKGVNLTQSFDVFDLVVGHLLDEGYAETEEAAVVMMANMSDEWRESILEGYGVDLEETKKWIQSAIKHPGALHRKLHVPAGEKIPAKKLAAAAKKGGKLGKEARLAQTLSSFHKEAVDQDGDGDNDFADVMIARMTASGKKTKKQAIAATKNKSYNKEELEAWVDELIAEGYDLSDYTWDEVAEIYMEELQQLDEISLKTKMKAYAASRDVDADYAYGSKVHDQGDRIKANIVKNHGEKAGEHAERHAEVSNFGRRDASGKYKGLPKSRIEKSDYRTTAAGKMHKQDQSELKRELRIRRGQKLRAADADDDN